ncbi:hypothetical protein [Natrialba sp. SSL1]|uniref:phage NrS-1 polymerase family protein n=1 Tax=Natrialba sp. SSL1 TaxID=1869245 RepID=UPI0008F8F474|nr:hypothetical protein [Natrialba sp. SSL1]OIB57330.1 hypothetical protein BBD46_02255 [Natrialba sp. SSL1]
MTDEFTLDESVLPAGLVESDQWICWREQERDGKPTKVPITPTTGEFASSTDDQTWTTFDDALEYTEAGNADGIGFVFTDNDSFVGIDLDDCRDLDTGAIDEAAQDIIDRLDSYTERSPSGTGYHVIVEGELHGDRNRKGAIEMYDSARFFTVTGEHVDETPTTVATRQDALTAVHREYVQDDATDDRDSDPPNEAAGEPSAEIDLDDEELLEKACNATNGEKFERLWNGNTLSYESQSEADMALCFLLAFWTGGDAMWMDKLFRQSGLLREKWDEIHYADGSTYGEKTLERAIANTSEFYDPDSGGEATQTSLTTSETSSNSDRNKSSRTHAYLAEKNRLLTDRVDELEETLKRKNERIDQLETKLEDLKAAGADRDCEIRRTDKEQAANTDKADEVSESASAWSRTKRLFGSRSEDR